MMAVGSKQRNKGKQAHSPDTNGKQTIGDASAHRAADVLVADTHLALAYEPRHRHRGLFGLLDCRCSGRGSGGLRVSRDESTCRDDEKEERTDGGRAEGMQL